jgi:hypothetical protein
MYSVSDIITNSIKVAVSIDNTNNVIIGHNSNDALVNKYTNCTSIGNNTFCSGNNQLQLGSTLVNTYSYGGVQNVSDRRDKTDIRDTQLGLSFIDRLRPVDFKWNYRNDYITPTNEYQVIDGIRVPITVQQENDGSKARTRYHHGLIAQEVKDVLTSLNIDFGGFQDHSVKGGKDQLTISYNELIAPMIKSIQELKARIEILEALVKK